MLFPCYFRYFKWLLVTGCLSFLLAGCTPLSRWNPSTGGGIPVRFIYEDPRAKSVCIAGSFNGWSDQADCMIRSSEAWTLEIRLPSGRHPYLLVVDGQNWLEDPGAFLSEDNGFGGRNSVLILE